jgi:hypothetical protein
MRRLEQQSLDLAIIEKREGSMFDPWVPMLRAMPTGPPAPR